MNKREKRKFIQDINDNFVRFLLDKVNSLPPEWTGIQVREWMAVKAQEQFSSFTMHPTERKEVHNTILVNNL